MKEKRKTRSSATVRPAERKSQPKMQRPRAVQNAETKPTTPTPAETLTLEELARRQTQIEKSLANLVPKLEAIRKASAVRSVTSNPPVQSMPPPPASDGSIIGPEIISKGLGIFEKALSEPEKPAVDPLTQAMMDVQKEAFISHWKNFLRERDLYVQLGENLVKHIAKHGFKGVIKFEE